jgi:hypothetical protein
MNLIVENREQKLHLIILVLRIERKKKETQNNVYNVTHIFCNSNKKYESSFM